MDDDPIGSELRRLDPHEHFTRICELADALFEARRFAEAEQAYWMLVPHSYRRGDDGEEVAQALLEDDLWWMYDAEDFHEFDKWASAVPTISRVGDRTNLADLCHDIADTHIERAQWEEAERMCRLAVAMTPRTAEFHRALAQVLTARGDPRSAVAERRYQQLRSQEERGSGEGA